MQGKDSVSQVLPLAVYTFSRVSDPLRLYTVQYNRHVPVRSIAPFQTLLIAWPLELLLACLQLSGEPLTQTTSHSTTQHFFGSSAIHPPVQCSAVPWRLCGAGPLLAAFSWIAHPNNFTFDSATLPWVLGIPPAKCDVNRINGCRENWRTARHTYIDTYKIEDSSQSVLLSHVLHNTGPFRTATFLWHGRRSRFKMFISHIHVQDTQRNEKWWCSVEGSEYLQYLQNLQWRKEQQAWEIYKNIKGN